VPGIISVLATLKSPSFWTPALIFLAGYAFACVWLSAYRLSFSSDSVSYAALFSPERRVSYQDIRSVGRADTTGPFESPLTMAVKTNTGHELRINAKVFPREATQKLLELAT